MSKRAVIYARQSTSKQQSIPAQISALEEFAKENNMRIDTIFQDVMSGKNTNREGFIALKRHLESSAPDCLLVWRYDRVARNLRDLHEFLTFCAGIGTQVISINEKHLNSKNPKSKDILLVQILGSIAEYQRKAWSENQQISYRYMHSEGKIVSTNVPYGYRMVDRELSVDRMEASIVSQIFCQYIQGDGYKKIAETLNANGLLNRKGKLWQASRIKAILDNSFYTGQIKSKYGDNNTHKRDWEKTSLKIKKA